MVGWMLAALVVLVDKPFLNIGVRGWMGGHAGPCTARLPPPTSTMDGVRLARSCSDELRAASLWNYVRRRTDALSEC